MADNLGYASFVWFSPEAKGERLQSDTPLRSIARKLNLCEAQKTRHLINHPNLKLWLARPVGDS
jgi:hypothetical protein